MCDLGSPLVLSKLESHFDLYGQAFVSINANVPLCCLLLHHSLPPPPLPLPLPAQPGASSATLSHLLSLSNQPGAPGHHQLIAARYISPTQTFPSYCLVSQIQSFDHLTCLKPCFSPAMPSSPLVWLYPHPLLLWLFFGKWDCSPAKTGLPHGFLRTTWQLTCLGCSLRWYNSLHSKIHSKGHM